MIRSSRWQTLLFFVLVLGLLAGPRAGWAAVKLFMKDGTFQLVKSYEVRGDRVRYYSIERAEWEEVPKSLVDFAATKRAEEEEKAAQEKERQEAREIGQQRLEPPAQAGFEVAPGIRLPQEQGVYAFDGARVIRMISSAAEVVTDKKRTALVLALPGPLLKTRALVLLQGPKAAVRILVAQPTFYVQWVGGPGTNLELIALKPGKQARVVEKVQRGIGVGKSGELRAAVPLERAEVAPNLFRLRPTEPLGLGEYALAELTQENLNLDVWDFGIDGALERTTESGRSAGASESPPTIRRSPKPPQD